MIPVNKSVLFINRVYPPAAGATGELLAELAPKLASAGWRVTVVAARPPGVTAAWTESEGVRVEWVGGLAFSRRSHWRRALSYLSLYPALVWRARRAPRADVVVTMTDPPMQVVLGPMVKWFKRCALVHWAQDVYPEVAGQLGVINPDGLLSRWLRGLGTMALRRYDQMIVVGSCMKRRLLDRGLRGEEIHVVPNWANTDETLPIPRPQNVFRQAHDLADRIVVMYSGNLGLAHPFAAMIEAAEILQRRAPNIVFVIVGEGPRLEWIQQQVASRNLANIRLLPPQPRAQLAQSLSAADIHLASMRDELCGLVVPSKVYGILAAARPAIFLGPRESEAAQLILRHQCGSVLPAATGPAVAECVLKWAGNPEELTAAGNRGRAAAERDGLASAVREFDRLLSRVVAS